MSGKKISLDIPVKKIDLAQKMINENIDLFKCPVCGSKYNYCADHSIKCSRNHCFDLAKRGYINLLAGSAKAGYDKQMFESRRIICQSGFYQQMTDTVCQLINNKFGDLAVQKIKILDAGCGEGSHLAAVIKYFNRKTPTQNSCLGVGIDISKEGIDIAAREYSDSNIIWSVADLAGMPFANRQFDVVLNILSPSNYCEFQRILAGDGLVIKVIPGPDYLKELRQIFYHGTNKNNYSNQEVLRLAGKNLNIVDTINLQYMSAIEPENWPHLINMTPLSWGAAEASRKEALLLPASEVTIDLTVIAGCSK